MYNVHYMAITCDVPSMRNQCNTDVDYAFREMIRAVVDTCFMHHFLCKFYFLFRGLHSLSRLEALWPRKQFSALDGLIQSQIDILEPVLAMCVHKRIKYKCIKFMRAHIGN